MTNALAAFVPCNNQSKSKNIQERPLHSEWLDRMEVLTEVNSLSSLCCGIYPHPASTRGQILNWELELGSQDGRIIPTQFGHRTGWHSHSGASQGSITPDNSE